MSVKTNNYLNYTEKLLDLNKFYITKLCVYSNPVEGLTMQTLNSSQRNQVMKDLNARKQGVCFGFYM